MWYFSLCQTVVSQCQLKNEQLKGTMHQKYDVVLKYSNLNPIFASAIIFAKFPKYSPPAANRAKICLLFDLLF